MHPSYLNFHDAWKLAFPGKGLVLLVDFNISLHKNHVAVGFVTYLC